MSWYTCINEEHLVYVAYRRGKRVDTPLLHEPCWICNKKQ
jgi:hypothetical protein